MALVTIGIVGWAVAPAVLRIAYPAPGDGKNVKSYGFDLSNLQLEEDTLTPAMQHRDMSPVLTNPTMYTVDELATVNNTKRNPFLVDSDLIVGISLGGETRAYPLHILNLHEVINDTIGGIPVVVYWNWPSGHIAVFERTIDNKEMQFGISGLSGNGSMLLYRKTDTVGDEQLFSAILGQSVTGSELHFKPIAHEVTSWESWFRRHPDTESIAPNAGFKKRYRKGDPRTYFLNDTIYFPVQPMPEDSTHPKTPIIAVQTNVGYEVFSIQSLYDESQDGKVTLQVDGQPITFLVDTPPLFAVAQDELGNTLPSERALWFTWYANHPDAVINDPAGH
jgi:hypothetical protein